MDRFTRLAPSADTAPEQTDTNTFRFVFSNERVGRDGHVVLNRGIQYQNWLRNPVVLFSHEDGEPPIGRGGNVQIGPPGGSCRLDVTFVDRDILPFAGTIRDLVAGKWLRAVSMSWQPIEWRYSDDSGRPGGIDFTRVDMLETSIVSLPALPDALLDARSFGIDTRPLADWAERRLDTRDYRAVPRPQLEAICRAARMPTVMRSAAERESRERRERERQSREIQARIRREEIADRLRALGKLDAAHPALRDLVKHHDRMQKHHRALDEHYEQTGDHLSEARAAVGRVMTALAELGEPRSARGRNRITRTLADLERSIRAASETHEDARDDHMHLGRSLGKAQAATSEVLDQAASGGVAA